MLIFEYFHRVELSAVDQNQICCLHYRRFETEFHPEYSVAVVPFDDCGIRYSNTLV